MVSVPRPLRARMGQYFLYLAFVFSRPGDVAALHLQHVQPNNAWRERIISYATAEKMGCTGTLPRELGGALSTVHDQ